MKLVDIRLSQRHAFEVNLKRAIYDACCLLDEGDITNICFDTLNEVFHDNPVSESDEDLPD